MQGLLEVLSLRRFGFPLDIGTLEVLREVTRESVNRRVGCHDMLCNIAEKSDGRIVRWNGQDLRADG